MAPVVVWRHAVDVQALRLLTTGTGMPDGPVTKQADSYLFAMALRNLLRAVELVRNTVAPERRVTIEIAQEAFRLEFPKAIAQRDVLEHFDDYLQGMGKLQKGKPPFPAATWTESTGPKSYKLCVGVAGHATFELDVEAAQRAALKLFNAATEAVYGE
jgi:hypothetical protein